MIFGALSNAAYRVSLHGPVAELQGGVQTSSGTVSGGTPGYLIMGDGLF